MTELLDYTPEELVERNMYYLVHPGDVAALRKSHMDLLHKGQVMTGYYRIMTKNGGYRWVQTCGTLICNNPPPVSTGSKSNASNNSTGSGSAAPTPCPTPVANANPTSAATPAPDELDQSIICVNYVLR